MLSFPAAAITGEEAALGLGILQFAYQLYHDWKTEHPDTPDSEYPGFNPGGLYGGGAGRDDLSAAYSDYVQDLPATGIDSSGGLIYSVPFTRLKIGYGAVGSHLDQCISFGNDPRPGTATISDLESVFKCPFNLTADNTSFDISFVTNSSVALGFMFYLDEKAPVFGTYTPIQKSFNVYRWDSNGCHIDIGYLWDADQLKSFYRVKDAVLLSPCSEWVDGTLKWGFRYAVSMPSISFQVIPDNTSIVSGDTYNITTRPTSITGGNYGIVGDDNKITKVEDNSTIVNETNNTYYNPATGTTVPIVDWSYDYSDRSYTVTTESGDAATITYGDENISITENKTVSGDTITNNYTIYYLVEGSGETPTDCSHNWTETSTTPATCTVPGSKVLTCSLCSQTKTETVPALGHNWQVKQTVTTQYDDTGQLTQQGYTIFECSRCHEQYKSEDGALPPGGGSGTDPGGDEGETIWDKLAHLIGAIGSGVISVIEGVLGKLLDALIALAEMLIEKLKTVVDAILKIFDEIPKLFGGFLDFLAALFPFLPPELMTILTFGVIAVVFIGIIKAVRR